MNAGDRALNPCVKWLPGFLHDLLLFSTACRGGGTEAEVRSRSSQPGPRASLPTSRGQTESSRGGYTTSQSQGRRNWPWQSLEANTLTSSGGRTLLWLGVCVCVCDLAWLLAVLLWRSFTQLDDSRGHQDRCSGQPKLRPAALLCFPCRLSCAPLFSVVTVQAAVQVMLLLQQSGASQTHCRCRCKHWQGQVQLLKHCCDFFKPVFTRAV